MLSAATSDPAVFRWRVSGGEAEPLPALTGFGGTVQSLAYSPTGDLLATGSHDSREAVRQSFLAHLGEQRAPGVPGAREALGLDGALLVAGIAGNFVLGALMTLGIGLYAPCMILVSLLGMYGIDKKQQGDSTGPREVGRWSSGDNHALSGS